MTPEEVRKIIQDELSTLIRSDRFTFQKHIQMLDQQNIQVGKETGTQLATESTQKLGLFGVTPVDQPEAVASPSADTGSLKTAVDAIRSRLTELGATK